MLEGKTGIIKSGGFILWASWMSTENFMTIHLIVVEILQWSPD